MEPLVRFETEAISAGALGHRAHAGARIRKPEACEHVPASPRSAIMAGSIDGSGVAMTRTYDLLVHSLQGLRRVVRGESPKHVRGIDLDAGQ